MPRERLVDVPRNVLAPAPLNPAPAVCGAELYFGSPSQLTMLLRWMADEPPKMGSASESRT